MPNVLKNVLKPVGAKDPYVPLLNVFPDWQSFANLQPSDGRRTLRGTVENKGMAPALQAFVELTFWTQLALGGYITRTRWTRHPGSTYKMLETVYPHSSVHWDLELDDPGRFPYLIAQSLLVVCYDVLLDPRPLLKVPPPSEPPDHTKTSWAQWLADFRHLITPGGTYAWHR
jgi:hypothetical protein